MKEYKFTIKRKYTGVIEDVFCVNADSETDAEEIFKNALSECRESEYSEYSRVSSLQNELTEISEDAVCTLEGTDISFPVKYTQVPDYDY